MKTAPRDLWLVGVLLVVLIGLTIMAALTQQAEAALPPLSSLSNQPDGGRALALWLEALGYPVNGQLQDQFDVPTDAAIALLLEPQVEITTPEWKKLDQWVEQGGTLILAGEGPGFRLAATHYDISTTVNTTISQTITLQTPLLNNPALPGEFDLATPISLNPQRYDIVAYLAGSEKLPIFLHFQQGKGRVLVAAFGSPFSNLSLKTSPNPALVLNVIAQAKQTGTIWFDEWHHGLSQSPPVLGPERWLRSTSLGHAILLVVGVIFLALLLQGRGFGRPLPITHHIRRRGSLEHITALANLSRRAGHRRAVMQQYHDALKRHLGKRYRLDPSLSDDAYVAALAGFDPHLDRAAVAELLKHLTSPQPSEEDMVRWAAKAAEMMNVGEI